MLKVFPSTTKRRTYIKGLEVLGGTGKLVMKKLICVILVTVFLISSIPVFTLAAGGSETQAEESRTVWESPFTLTTYGPENKVNSTFYTFPQVIWNGSDYIDYILNSSDMSAGIGSVYLKVCPDHTIFYDPYQTQETIQSESWNVEWLNSSTSDWEINSPTSNKVHYLVNSSGIYFDRTTTLSSGATLDEWYFLKISSELKISIIFHPVQAAEYRLQWLLNGINGTKGQWLTTTENITEQLVNDPSCSSISFANGNESKSFVDWSDARILNSTTGESATCFQQFELKKSVYDGQCQATIQFGDFSLTGEQPLLIDPTIATFNSTGASDGWIEQLGSKYPPNGYPAVYTNAFNTLVGQSYQTQIPPYWYAMYRTYLSFDTSTVPALAYNVTANLLLDPYYMSSPVNFTVQVWGGNQPIYDGNQTIMDGTQPIYNNNLTSDSWGSGMVQVASWNTANYQSGAYVNLSIPSNQITNSNYVNVSNTMHAITEFELNSSREGIQPLGDEVVSFYGDNSTCGPELEVSYCVDTLTINGETWYYRSASTSKAAIVLFGAWYAGDYDLYINSIEMLGEKDFGKVMLLKALIENGFSVYTPSNSSDDSYFSYYENDSTWVQDLTMYLKSNQTYAQVYLFGFSGGAVVVGNEIQKDYASRLSAAVMNCGPVNWTYFSGQMWHSAYTASQAKVATFFPEDVNDRLDENPPFYVQMQEYNDNEIVDKNWVNWTGGHGSFFEPNNTARDSPCTDNASVAVINWFNAYHPPSTPFTPVGSQTNSPNTTYSYTSGTVDPQGQNVSYTFNWGDGTNSTTGSYASGTNVTSSHAWSPGTYSITVQGQDSQNTSCWSPPLTVNVLNATITGCSLYYSNATQNLTTLDEYAPNDYFANVNFTWYGTQTSNVNLTVEVLNPSGSVAWKNDTIRYSSLSKNSSHTENNIDLKSQLLVYSGTGTLSITLTAGNTNSSIPWTGPVNIVSTNHSPYAPSLTYPGDGNNGTQYSFIVEATDPDQDNVQYVLKWGDGSQNTTLDWNYSGAAETGYHTWTNAGTYNVTAYVYDPYGAWSSQSVNVIMTNSSGGGGGGGCPYVYDWNGSAYVKDNNILPASQNGNGTDTKDYYLLQQPLVPVFSTKKNTVYSLQIGEYESNIDYIDQVKLMALDYSQGTSIAVTQTGEIFAYQNLLTPISAADNNGNSELSQISTTNGNLSDPSTYYVGNKGDWLVLDFGSITGPTANLVLRDDRKCAECIYVQVPDGSGGWQNVTVLNPRDYWSIEAVNMTAYLPQTGDFIVRLYWTQTHNLDFVGLDTSAQTPPQVTSAPPALAIHSALGDVTQKLLYDDEQCVQLVNGQTITIWFILPNQAQGTARSFILFTDGYYYTIT